jgi:hypothetical protein
LSTDEGNNRAGQRGRALRQIREGAECAISAPYRTAGKKGKEKGKVERKRWCSLP